MKTIIFINDKGGATKTTNALNVATGLGMIGHQVLMVDTDKQCNATEALLTGKTVKDVRTITPSSFDVLLDQSKSVDLSRAIRKNTREGNVHLIPSHQDNEIIDENLSNDGMWALAFERRKQEIADLGYEYVIVDLPPGGVKLKTLLLYASDLAIVPITPSKMMFDGLGDVLEKIDFIQNNMGKTINFRVLMTRAKPYRDSWRKASARAIDEMRETVGQLAYNTIIPEDDMIANAERNSASILRYAGKSKAAQAYVQLIREVRDHG